MVTAVDGSLAFFCLCCYTGCIWKPQKVPIVLLDPSYQGEYKANPVDGGCIPQSGFTLPSGQLHGKCAACLFPHVMVLQHNELHRPCITLVDCLGVASAQFCYTLCMWQPQQDLPVYDPGPGPYVIQLGPSFASDWTATSCSCQDEPATLMSQDPSSVCVLFPNQVQGPATLVDKVSVPGLCYDTSQR
eukprot:COSAG02_NODE_19585_length_874_cov_1.747097_1_plen_187_part_10